MADVVASGSWSGEITKRTRGGQDLIVATRRWTLIEDDVRPDVILTIDEDITERTLTEQQVLCARRSADLVEQVLLFARGVERTRVPIDVKSLLLDLRIIVKDTFPRNVRLTTDVPEGLPTVLGDSTQLQQVALNLAVNARDAMPGGGELTITADQVTLYDQSAASHPDALAGDYVRIVVEDTGIGMTTETQDRRFEPFFTTKALGVGAGLSLPTSAAIVRSHDGFIQLYSEQVYSELDVGTCFHVYLPASTEPLAVAAEASSATAVPRGPGRCCGGSP